jgi:hypothetical protein
MNREATLKKMIFPEINAKDDLERDVCILGTGPSFLTVKAKHRPLMFETPEFREQLFATIDLATRRLHGYEGKIIDYLQNFAVANERDDPSFLRGYSVPKAYKVAIRNVRRLLTLAVKYAHMRGDNEVMLWDVEKACRSPFRRFWPFCK